MRTRQVRPFLAALVLMAAVSGQAFGAPTYYTITHLGTLGGDSSAALSINNLGQVVGTSYNASHDQRGFVYENGTMTDLGTLAGGTTVARGNSDSGQIVGSSYVGNAYRAFSYENGVMTNLGTLSGDYDSYGRAVNSSGQVVGISRDFSYNAHAFLYDNGTMTNLGALSGFAQSKAYDINESGQVAGVSYNFLDSGRAFLYNNGSMTDLGTLGGASSYARAVNNAGEVVGGSYNASSVERAFIYKNGTMSDLGTLGGFTSYARDINNSGQVVGSSETAIAGVYHSFLYSNGTMTDLKSVVDPETSWNLRSALSINDSGCIVGVGSAGYGDTSAFMLTPITREYAGLSLATDLTNVRVLQGSTAAVGGASVAIDAAGYTATGYTLSSADASISGASGTVVPAGVTARPFGVAWNDTTQTGARSTTVTLENTSDPTDSGNHTMNVTGAVVANRVLNVAALGTSSAPVRVMAKKTLTTAIGTGSDPTVDGDDAATRVKTVSGGKIKSGNATVTYASTQPNGALLSQFDGVDQSANVDVTFAKKGHYTGTINLAPTSSTTLATKALLANGEATSLGATVQAANLSYDVDVLEARKLRATTKRIDFGDVLRGATVSGNFVVTSTNRDPSLSSATMVNVAPGGKQIGELTAAQTLVASGGSVNVAVSGTLNNYGSNRIRGALSVASAEDASVQDTSVYRDLSVQYKANVGIASFGRGTGATSFNTGGTILSAAVAAGSELSHLSSMVNPKRTLAANLTPASSVTGLSSLPAKTLYGAVGSEAEIVTSTPIATDATVTMQWRKRLATEAHDPSAGTSTTLPSGAWLASDVVKIGGVASDVTYALQMSFDNRINLAIDGPVNGTVENELPGLYVAQFDTTANQWVNAALSGGVGAGAQQGVLSSLSDFLVDNSTTPFSDLLGSWGVDPLTSSTGIGHSWAIVAGGGSGIFAVDPNHSATLTAIESTFVGVSVGSAVPEPSGLALAIAAAAALLGYALRRRS